LSRREKIFSRTDRRSIETGEAWRVCDQSDQANRDVRRMKEKTLYCEIVAASCAWWRRTEVRAVDLV